MVLSCGYANIHKLLKSWMKIVGYVGGVLIESAGF